MLTNFYNHINRYVKLTDEDKLIIAEYVDVRTVRKRELIQEPGQVCKEQYFVIKGCMRTFLFNEKGSELTLQFAIENWWISDYESFTFGNKALLNIQAIEDCEVVVWHKDLEESLFEKVPQLERYFRLMYQRGYTASIIKIRRVFENSREELYKHFLFNFPEFIQRVPNYMLASFLGFTPEYLSELRRKILS